MIRYAFSTLRFRKGGFIGAFLALLCAAALITACGTLLVTGLTGKIKTERYAAASVMVAGDQNVHSVTVKEKHGKKKVKNKAKPLDERVWLPAGLTAKVAAVPGVKAAVPELEFPAYVVTHEGRIISGPDDKVSLGHSWESAALTPFRLTDGNAPAAADQVVLDRELAARVHLKVGDRVTVQATGAPTVYLVCGIAAAEGGDLREQSSLFFSKQEAERLSGRPHQVAAIGVLPNHGADQAKLESAIAGALDGTTAQVHGAADRGAVEFLGASKARVQLISMGGAIAAVSLLVAILVVVGTFALSIQQRYRELALLRAVAATPRQIRGLIGREAAIIGLVAGGVGAVAGLPIAAWLHGKFVDFGTIPDALGLALSPYPVLAAVVVTVLGAWAAARVSARRVAQIRPAEALSEAAMETRPYVAKRLIPGVIFLVVGVVLLFVLSILHTEPASAPVTYLCVIMLSAAVALLGPVIAQAGIAALSTPLRASRISGYLAVANSRTNLRRFSGALTPLTLLVGMACTIIFVQSTLGHAAESQAREGSRADYTIASSGPGVPGQAAGKVRELSGVTGVTEVVRSTVRVGLDKFQIQGVTPEGLDKTMDPGVVSGSLKDLGKGSMAVSEAAEGGVGSVGSKVKVTMGDGTRVPLKVVAVYDRGLGFGDLTMAHDLVAAHVDNPLSSAVLVRTDRTKEELASAVSGYPGVHVLDGDQVDSLRADQQQSNAAVNFVAMGLIIAFTAIAVVNTLAMSTTGRTREFALLRLVGTTRLQVLRMLRLESLAIVLLAVVIGTVIAVATLTAFAIGMTGSAAPYLSAITYAGIVGVAACLALAATMIPARVSLAVKPADVIGARE
ncbi:ABC transporter permease [Streptomyces sp. NBC_01500]|uniref:ABC transporter permease n=1 Tax=Streptomyces sp. NBC_01500 TaxID=2903886 RepID=UPI00224DE53E|nr:FtsX-like permease family protein [Streptomyces sp. NBC_01500]MCX4554298.1 FtsX-like permease family protein [Streptomyces sp. NBC_01500]